ncbi:protein kinase domain-containing protein [Aeromicrobium choanae]|uniref:non-specific serine/threonine protein kinase n=1 Tax=Aeromicrobium choanae TaxID=1736691 RepID=A0A1T4Z8B6_9ACTN|nr:protein kinase [Aeromicrobium choanae]SKB10186.1 serine/threonine protein kinase [Aeromicrobium choanae]
MAVRLNQRYALDEIVGSGGMGAVHRATDTVLGRTVAVKVLRSDQGGDDVGRARMRSEAHLAASIHHPGVAQVFDYVEDDSTPEGSTFIVMQYVEGHSLSQLLKERGPMPPEQVMSVVEQVADGLQAAHDAGIVHRDLKPANIMLTPAGRTVLVDFGIAQAATSEPLTDTGSLVGTTDYISPEQVRGRSATPQSDVYALGVVAYHCLTGRSPFRRDTHIATAMAQLHDELPPFDPSVPVEVQELIIAMTAKKPQERPATAADVARRAAAIGAASSIDLPATFAVPMPARAAVETGVPLATATEKAVVTPRRRRPVVAYAAVGTAVLVAALLLGGRELLFGGAPVVPDVVGLQASAAADRIEDEGLTSRAEVVDVAGTPKGEVVEQSPSPGTEGTDGASVTLSVASGKVRVSAKSLIGKPFSEAAAVLEDRGFVVERDDVTRAGDTGDVVAVDKSGRLPDGSTVTLSVAVAPVAAPAPAGSGEASSGSGNSGKGNNGKAKGKNKGKGN